MKRAAIFLAITFGLTWAYEFGVVYPLTTGAATGVPADAAQMAILVAMFMPAIGVVITRLVTREGFSNALIKPRHLRQTFPWFLVAWFGPTVLIALGVIAYFLCFPTDFSSTMDYIVGVTQQSLAAQGAPAIDPRLLSASQWLSIGVGVLLGGIINIVPTFGEEWGWRGYLVPKMASRLSIVPNMLITGIIWGIWHAPLTILGHNYGTDYVGWPFTGIAAMCVFCVVVGTFLTYITIRTGSSLAAAIGHSAINAMAQLGIVFTVTGGNPFIGPAPTGILGGWALIVVAALMLWDMRRREKAGILNMPQAGLADGVRKNDKNQVE